VVNKAVLIPILDPNGNHRYRRRPRLAALNWATPSWVWGHRGRL
jgi:hypothetical protein